MRPTFEPYRVERKTRRVSYRVFIPVCLQRGCASKTFLSLEKAQEFAKQIKEEYDRMDPAEKFTRRHRLNRIGMKPRWENIESIKRSVNVACKAFFANRGLSL